MTTMGKDDLFDVRQVTSDFVFDRRVATVFDDMIERSVPCYKQVIGCEADLLAHLARPDDEVVDFGCSTGTTLLALASEERLAGLRFRGVDSSAPMIAEARSKAASLGLQDAIDFCWEDIEQSPLNGVGCVLMNYTLQFFRPPRREPLLRRIREGLRSDGILILSEKLLTADPKLNRLWIEMHHGFKRKNEYSSNEIAKKREALENVLLPYTLEENLDLLRAAGFSHTEVFFRWFNFASLLAIR